MTTVEESKNGTSIDDNQKGADGFDYQTRIELSQIEIDEEFNARIGDEGYRGIEELTESLRKIGQLQPLTVIENKKTASKPYFLVVGFRRARAFAAIKKSGTIPVSMVSTSTKGELCVDVVVKHLEGKSFDDRLLEAKQLNLASDSSHDPLRVFELAERCHYLNVKLGIPATKIAARIGKTTAVVNQWLACYKKLTPEIRKVWGSAPDPEKEIPISRLLQWTKGTPTEQKKLLDAYVSGDDNPVFSDEETEDGEKKPKRRLDKSRPGTKDIRAELEKVVAKMEESGLGKVDEARYEGMSKALRFALGEISRIF